VIYGIGTDIVEIGRIRDAVDKWGDRFLKRIYTDNEIAYCYRKKDPFPHLAARFAAKEALFKASNIHASFSDIETVNEDSGKPFIHFREDLLTASFKSKSLLVHVTLSHERSHAIATVILERKTE